MAVNFINEKGDDFWEIEPLDDEEIRLIIPCEHYYILATTRVVRTNKGVLRKMYSGEIELYHKTIETLIKALKDHKQPHKMQLLLGVCYDPYN